MSLPSEYVIEDAFRSIDDVIVYRANHPIHGQVNVYLPDDTLPLELASQARRRLYQNGLQMREVSLLDVPLTTKALEVSQNPTEPYIVTKYVKHDLEEFISNGITIKPKRMFTILSQVLQAVINLAENDCAISHVHPRQIKLFQLDSGDISFNVIEGTEQQIYETELPAEAEDEKLIDITGTVTPQKDVEEKKTYAPTLKITQKIDEAPVSKDTTSTTEAQHDIDLKAVPDDNVPDKDDQRQLRTTQRNIYLLGNVTYQLIFGRKYLSNDKVAEANIKKLAGRWRKILNKALSRNLDFRYDSYEFMLQDIRKASNKNKRIAVASIPFLVILVLIGGYFAYERYRQYKIMTSEAGQAIESFIDIVNEIEDEVPELKEPEPPPPTPDEQTILKPFEEIEPVVED